MQNKEPAHLASRLKNNIKLLTYAEKDFTQQNNHHF